VFFMVTSCVFDGTKEGERLGRCKTAKNVSECVSVFSVFLRIYVLIPKFRSHGSEVMPFPNVATDVHNPGSTHEMARNHLHLY
jgi:hypothetical protein